MAVQYGYAHNRGTTRGLPLGLPSAAIFSTTGIPEITFPNSVYRLGSASPCEPDTTKNCLPSVHVLPELAIAKEPSLYG